MRDQETEFLLRRIQQEKERVRLAANHEARRAHGILSIQYAHRAMARVRDADESVSFENFGLADADEALFD